MTFPKTVMSKMMSQIRMFSIGDAVKFYLQNDESATNFSSADVSRGEEQLD